MSFDPTRRIMPIAQMMDAISEKQRIVASNIANAHTPGYHAKSASFSELLFKLNSPFETELSREMGTTLPMDETTGQGVNLPEQMIDMQKNNLFFSVASRRLSTIFNTLRTASQIGR